mmetsp:Transcript_88582/g.162375  ORF Transcript_88582/g.162375 Transcript_88582/m.162375 type:complete len:702 (+) Transcript_88582:64-2169(+)
MAPCNSMFVVLAVAMHMGYISLGTATSEASTAEAGGSPRMRGAGQPTRLQELMSRAATAMGLVGSTASDHLDELEQGKSAEGPPGSVEDSHLVDSPTEPEQLHSVEESGLVEEQPHLIEESNLVDSPTEFEHSPMEHEHSHSVEKSDLMDSPIQPEQVPKEEAPAEEMSEELRMQAWYAEMLRKHEEDAIRSQKEHMARMELLESEQPDSGAEPELSHPHLEDEEQPEWEHPHPEDEEQPEWSHPHPEHQEQTEWSHPQPEDEEQPAWAHPQPEDEHQIEWEHPQAEDKHYPSVFTIPLDKQYVPVVKNNITVTYKTAYFGTIYVGSPEPQPFSVLFDTGSGHFFIPSEKCDLPPCLKRRRYQRDLSYSGMDIDHDGNMVSRETEAADRDKVAVEYGTGEVEGEFVNDLVCLTNHSGDHWFDHAPDCTRVRVITTTEMSTEPFDEFAFDGVMGLGLASLAVHPEFSFFEQMANTDRLHHMQFGVFLSDDDTVASEISFGGHDPQRVASNLSWVPVFEPERGYWQIHIQRITVGGEPFQECEQGDCIAVVDTGTGLLGVPKHELSNFHWLLARRVLDKSEDVDCREFPGPEVVFHLDGFNITVGPRDYSRPSALRIQNTKSNTTDVICRSSLLPVEMPVEMSAKTWILGEPALRKYYTTYDWNAKEVGFALAKPPLPETEKRHTIHGQPPATEVRAASIVTV